MERLYFIDFEASSFEGYPIQCGIACLPLTGPIIHETYWVRPTGAWMLQHEWDPEAAQAHGIKMNDLMDHGQNPDWVCEGLNDHLGDNKVYCRSLDHDGRWLTMLYDATGMVPAFTLERYSELLDKLGVGYLGHDHLANEAVEYLTENGFEVGRRYRPSAVMMAAEVKMARENAV